MKVWICPGSFDPVTMGHMDIIERASGMCDRLIVAIGANTSKKCFFPLEERVELLRKALSCFPNVEVDCFKGLLIRYAREKKAVGIVKGLRAVSDFEYEFQMALLNKRLDEKIETVFLMTSINYSFLSSSAVREIASNGGDIEGLVPDTVRQQIINKLYDGGEK
ncbi:MAG: pantetheine-phosphate adenylyltransferase [Clostridia bacterium]